MCMIGSASNVGIYIQVATSDSSGSYWPIKTDDTEMSVLFAIFFKTLEADFLYLSHSIMVIMGGSLFLLDTHGSGSKDTCAEYQ